VKIAMGRGEFKKLPQNAKDYINFLLQEIENLEKEHSQKPGRISWSRPLSVHRFGRDAATRYIEDDAEITFNNPSGEIRVENSDHRNLGRTLCVRCLTGTLRIDAESANQIRIFTDANVSTNIVQEDPDV